MCNSVMAFGITQIFCHSIAYLEALAPVDQPPASPGKQRAEERRDPALASQNQANTALSLSLFK